MKKKVLKVNAILSVFRIHFVTYSQSLNLCVVKTTYQITLHTKETIYHIHIFAVTAKLGKIPQS